MTGVGGPYGPPSPPSAGPPPGAPISPDGNYWWDGTRWNAVPPPPAPPPPPVAQPWSQPVQVPSTSWGAPAYSTPLAGGPAVPPSSPAAAPARSSGARWIVLALVAVVVVAGAVVAFVLLGGKSSNGLASKTPDQIVQAAATAAKGASGFEMSGTGSFGGGVSALDFKVRGSDLEGSMKLNGDTVGFDYIAGNVYFNAPSAFWVSEGLPSSMVGPYAGKWVEIAAGSPDASSFPDVSSLTNVAATLENHGKLAADGTGTVDGQAVVFVKDTTDGGVVAVATTGPGYPMQLTSTGSTSVTLDFSNWNGVSAFTPPANPVTLPSS